MYMKQQLQNSCPTNPDLQPLKTKYRPVKTKMLLVPTSTFQLYNDPFASRMSAVCWFGKYGHKLTKMMLYPNHSESIFARWSYAERALGSSPKIPSPFHWGYFAGGHWKVAQLWAVQCGHLASFPIIWHSAHIVYLVRTGTSTDR